MRFLRLKSSEKRLTPAQAADLLSVSPITIRYWAKEGRLNFVTTPGGHRRFERSEINKLLDAKLVNNEKENIIIVEDDRQHADLLVEYIAVLYPDIKVNVAYSGFEAGTMIQALQPCLIFLDLVMPDIDGFAVCKYIKLNVMTKNIPIIAMSGYSDQEVIDQILNAGASQFLVKPIKLSALKAAVDLCLFNGTQ